MAHRLSLSSKFGKAKLCLSFQFSRTNKVHIMMKKNIPNLIIIAVTVCVCVLTFEDLVCSSVPPFQDLVCSSVPPFQDLVCSSVPTPFKS